MLRDHGQATVEAVGITLAVALLLGGLAGVFGGAGIAGRVADAVASALAGAIGLARTSAPRAPDRPTANELARFQAAIDPTRRLDDRPTLHDVRLSLRERLGETARTPCSIG